MKLLAIEDKTAAVVAVLYCRVSRDIDRFKALPKLVFELTFENEGLFAL